MIPLPAEMHAQLKVALFHALDYAVLEPAVAEFHNSAARHKITSCPARTSKSYSAAKDALPDIFTPGIQLSLGLPAESMICWIVAPNYDLAKEFDYFWEDLVERKDALGFDYRLGKTSKSPKQGNMEIEIIWGHNSAGQEVRSWIVVKSATNEKSLQAEQVDVAILSEAAELPEIVWFKYLAQRCKRTIWPTTPKVAAAWIWKLIEQSKLHPELKTEAFQFTGRANPKYDWPNYWVEHIKAEMEIAGTMQTVPANEDLCPAADNGHDCFDEATDCAAMKHNGFAEQFGGLWTFHRGRVMPLREKPSEAGAPSHVIDHDFEWMAWAEWSVAIDYGYSDGVAVGFWVTGPSGEVILRRSIYDRELVKSKVIDRIADEWKWICDRFEIKRPTAHRYIGDPKQPEVEELFRQAGLPVWNVDKHAQSDRKAGHQQIMDLMAMDPVTGQPRFFVHRDNTEIIDEWRVLRRNPKVKDEGAPNAFIGPDHGYDMTRYFVMSRPAKAKAQPGPNFFHDARMAIARENRRRRHEVTVRPATRAPSWGNAA